MVASSSEKEQPPRLLAEAAMMDEEYQWQMLYSSPVTVASARRPREGGIGCSAASGVARP